ncbi:MAG TPA: WD40 repeat domain-containing protein [Polyangia bacterium]|nr:WD40 repeat domain-containing protein [Polyangia bacterium]
MWGAGCGGRGFDKLLGDPPGQGGPGLGGAPGGGPGGAPAGGGGAAAGDGSGDSGGGMNGGTNGGGAPGATGGSAQTGPGIGGHPSGCCLSPRPMGGAPGTGAGGAMNAGGSGAGGMTATGGAGGGMTATGGAGMTATGGAGGGMTATGGTGGVSSTGQPGACSSFTVGNTFTLAPAAAGQAYLRCGTLGPEKGWDVTPSPSGDRLAARTSAGTVRLIATSTWTEVAQLTSPVGQMDAAAFSPDGSLLATLSAEMGEVTLWRSQDGAFQSSFAGPPASTIDTLASSLAFSSDGHRLATSLGTVIDLTTGTSTSWRTGAPDKTVLTTNPENLGSIDGGGIPLIRFTAGDAKLFIVTRYEIGNSPFSIRLELRDPATGAQTLLFDMYDRALQGYAISDDGRYIALDGNQEAAGSNGPYKAGLFVVDATTGTQVAGDATATSSQVLAFAHAGSRLFIQNGATVAAVNPTNLQGLSSFAWPSGVAFEGVTPTDALIGSGSGATSEYDAASGAVLRTFAFSTASVRFTKDGRFAVGNGDPAALFHFWREADGTDLCDPAAGTGSAPPIASLGTNVTTDFNPGSTKTTSADGSVTATSAFLIHGHAQNFYDDALADSATGTLLRQFGAFGDQLLNASLALSVPNAAKAYTPVFTPLNPPGPDVAVWCR